MVSLLVQVLDCRCCGQPPHRRRWVHVVACSVSSLQSVYPCVWCCVLTPTQTAPRALAVEVGLLFNLALSCPSRQWTHCGATQSSFHDVFTQQDWKHWWKSVSLVLADICLSITARLYFPLFLFFSSCSSCVAITHSPTAWHRYSDKSSPFNNPPKIRRKKNKQYILQAPLFSPFYTPHRPLKLSGCWAPPDLNT